MASAPGAAASKLCFLEIRGVGAARTVCFRPDPEPDAAHLPIGALIDRGAAFGDRGAGERYGWTIPNHLIRFRAGAHAPDARFAGVAYFQHPDDAIGYCWSIAVPNGDYVVWLAAGDGEHAGTGYAFAVNGIQTDGLCENRYAQVARTQWAAHLTESCKRLENDHPELARLAYVELLVCFADEPPAAGALDGMLRTFLVSVPQTVAARTAAFAAFRKFVAAELPASRAGEEADLLVARTLYQGGDLPGASAALSAFLHDHPQSAFRCDAELLAGVIQAQQGRVADALARFRRIADDAATSDAMHARALYLVGWACLFDRRYGEARTALETVVAKYAGSDQVAKAKELLDKLPPAEAANHAGGK